MKEEKREVKGLYQKLLVIQNSVRALQPDKDTKSVQNPNGFKYVTGAKLLNHVKPLMCEYGLLLKQEILSIENTRQDYQTKYSSKSEILSKVMMRFTWVDSESGETDVNLWGANGQNDWDKGVGSAMTYGERYFLLKYFHVATDQDDCDAIIRDDAEPQKMVEQPVTPAPQKTPLDTSIIERNNTRLQACKSLEDLGSTWKEITSTYQPFSLEVKEFMKNKLTLKQQ